MVAILKMKTALNNGNSECELSTAPQFFSAFQSPNSVSIFTIAGVTSWIVHCPDRCSRYVP